MCIRASGLVALVALCLAEIGCTSPSSMTIVDQTGWEVLRPLPAEAVRLDIEVAHPPGADLEGRIDSTLERELAARGFAIDSASPYKLSIRCGEPVSGTRGLPVTSRFVKITLDLRLAHRDEEGPILLGRADGIVEESAVSIFSGSEETRRRLESAVGSAIGKIARYMAAAIRDGGNAGEMFASPEPPVVEPVKSGQGVQTLAVLDFDVGEGVDASVGQVLADLCRDVIGKTGRFVLLERNNMKAILGEQDFAAAVRCTETSCIVQYGRVLHARKMIHGRASKIGEQYVLFISLSDVNTAVVDATEVSPRSDSIEGLADLLPGQASRLVQGF